MDLASGLSQVLPFLAVLATTIGAGRSVYLARKSREIDDDSIRQFESLVDEATKKNIFEQLDFENIQRDLRENKSKHNANSRKLDTSIVVALVGAAALLISGFAQPLVGRSDIPCAEQIEKVVAIVKSNPAAWVDLRRYDDYEEACHLNEVVRQLRVSATKEQG